MPLYECKLCKLKTRLLGDYNRHLNTSKHKKNLQKHKENMVMSQNEPIMSQNEPAMSQNEPTMSQNEPAMSQNEPVTQKNIEKSFKCDYCDELFTTHPHKRRHEMHRCKKNSNTILRLLTEKDKYIQQIENEKEEMKKEHEKERKDLYKKIDELISKVGNTYNQNIILNNYGSEDLSHITDTFKTQMLKIPYMMIPKMIEQVHFNKEKPENKNIAFTNKKENRLKVYTDNKWIYKNKKDVISNLVDKNYHNLDTHYDKNNPELNSFYKNNYLKFREFMNEGDKELVETLKAECENVLLSNR